MPVPVASVDADIAAAVAAMTPGGAGAAGAALRYVKRNWPEQKMDADGVAVYVEAIQDIPADLLALAAKRAVRECRFWPRPADLREQVKPELSARRRALSRLEFAAMKLRRQPPERKPMGSERRVHAPRINHIADLRKDEVVEVTPEEAAAMQEQWVRDMAR